MVGAAVVEVHDERPDGLAVGVDRHRRRVLAVDADVRDVGGRRGAAAATSWTAPTTAAQSSAGSWVAISPSRTVVIGRAAAAISRPVSSTSATLALVVPTSIPSVCVTSGG